MLNNIGIGEIIVVVVVLLILFGGKKLPELARGLGESAKELKNVKLEIEHALKDVKSDEEPQEISTPEDKTKGGES